MAEYAEHLEQQYDSKCTLKNHKSYVSKMLGKIDKDYDKIKIKDILTFLNSYKKSSAEAMKFSIREFFIHYDMKDLADAIPKNPKALGKQTKGDESVLTKEDIENIIEAPRQLMDRTLVEIFVITGARRNEILSLNIGDVKVLPDTIWIDIRQSKTKRRKIPAIPNTENPVARYPKFLIQWLKFRDGAKPNEPLFLAISGKRLGETAVYDRFRWLNENVELSVNLTPHVLRHTGATYDGQYLTDTMMCQKYGWTIGSVMAQRYVHANLKQLEHILMRQAGLKEDEAKRGKICPRCGEPNNLFAEVCSKCHQTLDYKKLMEEAEEKERGMSKLAAEIKELREENETLQDNFAVLLHRMDELMDKKDEEVQKAEVATGFAKQEKPNAELKKAITEMGKVDTEEVLKKAKFLKRKVK